jgi:hypothetical protein
MKYFIYILLLASSISIAQVSREQITGTIISATEEPIEGITVFNLNSLEGTITNEKGIYFIDAREGDKLRFKAVQFEPFTLVVTAKTMERKSASITLNEGVNVLDEVILRDNIMKIDVKRTAPIDLELEKIDPEKFNTKAIDRVENTFSDRVRSPEEYPIENTAFKQSGLRMNNFNMIGLLGALLVNTSLSEMDLSFGGSGDEDHKEFDVVLLKNKYSKEYLLEYLDLKEDNLYEFMYFAKDHGLDQEMLDAEDELKLLQFLSDQAVDFKKRKKIPETKSKN